MRVPWNKGKTKKDFPQLSNSGVKRGGIPWNKGKKGLQKCSDKTKEKMSLVHKGKKHEQIGLVKDGRFGFKKGQAPWNKNLTKLIDKRIEQYAKKLKGKKRSIGQREKQRKTSSFYIDGRCSLRELISKRMEWRQWREIIFERDNYTCQKCSNRGGVLHPHHLKSFSSLLSEFLKKYSQFSPIEDKEILLRLAITYQPFWDIDNGQTLCVDCHKETDNYGSKEYKK